MHTLKLHQKATGKAPPALVNRPSGTVVSNFYLESFFFLSQFRGVGLNGPAPLSFSDVREYAKVVGLNTADAVLFFSDVMAGLDSVYLLHMSTKKPPMPTAGPGRQKVNAALLRKSSKLKAQSKGLRS